MENKYQTKTEKEMESSAWNFGRGYVFEVVLDTIKNIRQYRMLSIFGVNTIEQDVYIYDLNLKNTSRLMSLRRWMDSLKVLMLFTKFNLKDKDHIEIYKTNLSRLKKISTKFKDLKSEVKSRGKIQLTIDEELFGLIIEDLDSQLDGILDILNKVGLIFKQEEVKNPKEAILR